jgi:uncharacterized repeat protein (TIGR01451 family)
LLLETINAKNGSTYTFDESTTPLVTFVNNPMLQSICVDDISYYNPLTQQNMTEAAYWMASVNNPNVMITSYCSFSPGGEYNTITGNISYDCTGNSLPAPNIPLVLTQGSQSGTTYGNLSGNFIGYAGIGNVTVSPQLNNPSYFFITPPNFTYNFAATGETVITDFCITPNGNHSDLEINLIPLVPAVPGFSPTYKVTVTNNGNQTLSGSMLLSFDDSVMDFTSSVPPITSQTGNTLSWNYSNLMPFATTSSIVTLHLNSPMDTPAVNGGDLLTFNALVSNVGDETPADNSYVLNQTVVNSLDPNDKTCLEGNNVAPELIGEYVHYKIRFENTGTFPAQNIVVKDMIDTSKFDVATLVPLDGSHIFETRISTANKVEFIFENIMLPFDDANNDGYVAFKIKTLPTLAVGDTFSNSASIYFDYNFPIVTNTATTTIEQLGTNDFEFSDYFMLYPNPAVDVLHVKGSGSIEVKSVSLYNTMGQLLMVISGTTADSTINVSTLKTGTYFLKINSTKGSTVSKFIKE